MVLADQLRTASGVPFAQARFLVTAGDTPLGFATVELDEGRLDRDLVFAAIAEQLGPSIEAYIASCGASGSDRLDLAHQPLPRQADVLPPLSIAVVVATRDRPEQLRRCLASLRALEYEFLEVVVVDNGSRDDATERAFAETVGGDRRFRLVAEPRQGLSRAQNRGLQEVRADFVAFTDDDVRVDDRWINGIRRGFARRADVACVTGLVVSATLESAAERYFDARVWWSAHFEPRIFEAQPGPGDAGGHPYTAGLFGTGANMSFRVEVLRALGGFDEALGTGSPSAGGSDLDAFVRILLSGHALAYEPSALVWHEHRASEEDLERQLYTYGKGLASYLTKFVLSPRTGPAVLIRVPRGIWHAVRLGRRSAAARSQSGIGSGVSRAELRGFLAGPAAYLRARRDQDPENRRLVRPSQVSVPSSSVARPYR